MSPSTYTQSSRYSAQRFSVAPMLDWTDRHCRHFHRLLSGEALLYTEMVTTGVFVMNKDQADGNWKQFKGKVKEKWGKLTDDDLTVVEGKRDQLIGKIQERYGHQKDVAEKEVKAWEDEHKYHW